MPLEEFSLESLLTMDSGQIRVGFQHALSRLYADCVDRPAVDKGRKLKLIVALVPFQNDAGY